MYATELNNRFVIVNLVIVVVIVITIVNAIVARYAVLVWEIPLALRHSMWIRRHEARSLEPNSLMPGSDGQGFAMTCMSIG